MRLIRSGRRQWTCHWSHMTRRTAEGREIRTPVWICEYPYRTMLSQPCTDCEGHETDSEAEIRRVHALISEAAITS